ncbi:hypothetical protein KSP39_PZI017867 [Platanthera zijinensis]|uniref:Uncharacterized protein n=1 Tax=Platanthera zijinensis TaxID=2320716 RepID=A0AAP0B6K9_9ASPA
MLTPWMIGVLPVDSALTLEVTLLPDAARNNLWLLALSLKSSLIQELLLPVKSFRQVNLAPNPRGTFNVQSSMNRHSDNANFMWPKWGGL